MFVLGGVRNHHKNHQNLQEEINPGPTSRVGTEVPFFRLKVEQTSGIRDYLLDPFAIAVGPALLQR